MTAATTIERPELTMPDDVAEAVREAYGLADVILEYGSGGSTVMAAEMTGKTIFSVECDMTWARGMQQWFDENPGVSPVTLHKVNIGPTKAWAYPRNHDHLEAWHLYPTSVWSLPAFKQPDVVLIDGRFRPACLLATMMRTQKPVTVIFDDYFGRPHYAMVEKFAGRPNRIGRAAWFQIDPTPVTVEMAEALAAMSVVVK